VEIKNDGIDDILMRL